MPASQRLRILRQASYTCCVEQTSTLPRRHQTGRVRLFPSGRTIWSCGLSTRNAMGFRTPFAIRVLGSCSTRRRTPICTFAVRPGRGRSMIGRRLKRIGSCVTKTGLEDDLVTSQLQSMSRLRSPPASPFSIDHCQVESSMNRHVPTVGCKQAH
jgi:hypothetical protein